jgi:hypothetical protein
VIAVKPGSSRVVALANAVPYAYLNRCGEQHEFPMNRHIARMLLVLLLVSIFVPLALAISTPPSHACCMRKPLHAESTHEAQFNTPPGCCSQHSCRLLTTRQWAHIPSANKSGGVFSSPLKNAIQAGRIANLFARLISNRGPPAFSFS